MALMNKLEIMEAYRQHYRNKPFDWKSANCANFAYGITNKIYGLTFAPYNDIIYGKSKFQILYRLRKDEKFISDIITETLGEPIDPALARPGDLVVEGEGYGQNVGVCYDTGWSFFQKEKGLVAVYNKHCTMAWRCE